MIGSGSSAVVRFKSETPWQPLKRMMSRHMVQRMNVCRRNRDALTALGKKRKWRKVIENWWAGWDLNPGPYVGTRQIKKDTLEEPAERSPNGLR